MTKLNHIVVVGLAEHAYITITHNADTDPKFKMTAVSFNSGNDWS